MEKRIEIAPEHFCAEVCGLWKKPLLLTAGDFAKKEFNMMTVGWGAAGVIWGKPFVMTLVRPQRFTLGLMEHFSSFTLCAFPESKAGALQFCGSHSGRDLPRKAEAAGLTPCPAALVAAPGYEEAELVMECRKTYESQLAEESFLNPATLHACYPDGNLHKIFFGEIVRISGAEKYLAK